MIGGCQLESGGCSCLYSNCKLISRFTFLPFHFPNISEWRKESAYSLLGLDPYKTEGHTQVLLQEAKRQIRTVCTRIRPKDHQWSLLTIERSKTKIKVRGHILIQQRIRANNKAASKLTWWWRVWWVRTAWSRGQPPMKPRGRRVPEGGEVVAKLVYQRLTQSHSVQKPRCHIWRGGCHGWSPSLHLIFSISLNTSKWFPKLFWH